MIEQISEHWQELCEQASNEQDPERLSRLVGEILRAIPSQQWDALSEKQPNEPQSANLR
jgi:hypothetical protein